MQDLIFVVVSVAFFVVSIGYVTFCDRVKGDVATLQTGNPNVPVPVDLVTASASGLDPHITPAAAEYQVRRVAAERKASEADIRRLVSEHTEARTWGLLGESRVNVLELNLALDARFGSIVGGK